MEIEEHKITPDSSLIGGRNDRFEEQKNIHKSRNDKTYNLSMDTGKNAILNADFKGRKSEKQIEKTDIVYHVFYGNEQERYLFSLAKK